jgi:hypothetical protein
MQRWNLDAAGWMVVMMWVLAFLGMAFLVWLLARAQ